MDLKEVLYGIARAIVDNPDEVVVTSTEDDDSVTLTLNVAEGDMGLVIGRHGRIAKAIRTVMKSAAGTVGKKVNVEIR
jgi:predicted RNA-binding protein YlqC (UPF0109 family)